MSEFVKEATAGSGTGAGTTATAGEVNDPSAILTLQQLESIDNDIMKILQHAQETVTELEKNPNSDFNKLQQLSQEYFRTCEKVRVEMKNSVKHIHPYCPGGQGGSYGLRKKVELAEAVARINNDETSSSS